VLLQFLPELSWEPHRLHDDTAAAARCPCEHVVPDADAAAAARCPCEDVVPDADVHADAGVESDPILQQLRYLGKECEPRCAGADDGVQSRARVLPLHSLAHANVQLLLDQDLLVADADADAALPRYHGDLDAALGVQTNASWDPQARTFYLLNCIVGTTC